MAEAPEVVKFCVRRLAQAAHGPLPACPAGETVRPASPPLAEPPTPAASCGRWRSSGG